MPIDARVHRSRHIRKRVLLMLAAADEGCPGVGIAHGQILGAFANEANPYTAEEIGRELADLGGDGLIHSSADPYGGPLPERIYDITSRGRDFVRAQFPWGGIDEFSGAQRP